MAERHLIRNSTAEFLIFQLEGKEQGVEVYYKDKTVWCTQKAMGMLFDCSSDNVGLHLKNIFASGELSKDSVTEKISATASDGKIVKTDVSIAKNYLKQGELEDMGQLVNGVLELAERMAKRHIPMTMEDWAKQIDTILAAGRNEVLQTAGNVTAEEAKEHAETEFEKYRIIQDRLFQSDFDRYLGALPFEEEGKM